MLNFIKRLSGVICVLLLAVSFSSGFAQVVVAGEIQTYTTEELQKMPIKNLEAELKKLEAESAKQQVEIKKLSDSVDQKLGDTTQQKNALEKKQIEFNNFYSEKLMPVKQVWNSRNTTGLKGILTIQGQGMFTDAASFLGSIIDLLIKFVGSVALIILVVGGVRLVVAAGNDNAVQNAKQMITYAVIGLAVALLAYIIVTFIHGLLYR